MWGARRRGSAAEVGSFVASDRADENGAAYAGSQLQTQLYVNKRTARLDHAVRGAFSELGGAVIEWRSPLATDAYREYWDRGFLERVDLGHHGAELHAFWPTGGPRWDALAVIGRSGDTRPGVLLVEGKSYPHELFGAGTAAKPGSQSRELIERSLAWTQRYLGVEGKTPEDWCGRLYQSASASLDPPVPGIYLFSKDKRPVYVGQSRNLQIRLRQHTAGRGRENQASLAFNERRSRSVPLSDGSGAKSRRTAPAPR